MIRQKKKKKKKKKKDGYMDTLLNKYITKFHSTPNTNKIVINSSI